MVFNGSQGSDLFELGPIIEALSRESKHRKRRFEEVEEDGEGTDMYGPIGKRVLISLEVVEATSEGSPRSP